jgi:hypothetical protein
LLDQVPGNLAIAGFGDDLDVTGMFEDLPDASSDNGMIVGEQDADRRRSTVHDL